MRKIFTTFLLLSAVLLFQFCSHSKKLAAPVAMNYQTNVLPIIQASCTPCHIAGKGNKKSLDNYLAAKDNVDEMLARIQKSPTEKGFMPAMHDKLPEPTIAVIANWKKAGLLEK
jgi:cytochrome c553